MAPNDRRRIVKALALVPFAGLLGTSRIARADNFPSKPIRVIYPFLAGGDAYDRYVLQAVSDRIKQPIVVENRPGAGGTVGSNVVAKAAPDGYTLLVSNLASNAIAASLYPRLPYNALNDFEHIGMIGTIANALLVSPTLPATTLGELIDLAKAKPGTLTFGSVGVGSSPHLSGEMFKSQAGIDIVHVSYNGSGPALLDLMAGRIAILFNNLPTAIPVIKSGKLRVFGTTGSVRAPMLPDIPTLKEQGLRNFEVESWHGLSAPAKTPAEIVNLLNAELRAAIADPAVLARLAGWGVSAISMSPAQYRDFIAQEIEKWRIVVKASGARVD